MRQSKARRERYERRKKYEQEMRDWENCRPPWFCFFARRKWMEKKPVFDRR